MSTYQLNKEFYDKPMRLSPEKKENPYMVFYDLFDGWGPLSRIREYITNLQYVALTSDNDIFESPTDRSDVISFCERLEEVAEAAYLLKPKKDPFKNSET